MTIELIRNNLLKEYRWAEVAYCNCGRLLKRKPVELCDDGTLGYSDAKKAEQGSKFEGVEILSRTMPSQHFVREIEISDREASRYFEFLEGFLGRENIDSVLARIDREIRQERGAYLYYWVKPKNAFWLGVQEGRKFIGEKIPFAGNLSSDMELSLELAAKLMTLTDSMPEQKVTEFRDRILGSDSISPIFFELNIASHFWQMGFDIEWFMPSDKPGIKSPEFIAGNDKYSIEVECKTKKPDAGRKIQRQSFYRLIDAIPGTISGHGFSGQINIVVPQRLPIDRNSQDEILNSIGSNIKNPVEKVTLDNGIEISFSIKKVNQVLTANDIASKISEIRKPHSIIGVIFSKAGSKYINPVIICVDSMLTDQFLKDVFESLREANHQFSGKLPSLICCFVPEIEDFTGMESESAVAKMTEYFFSQHSNRCVFAVSYISDTQRDEFGMVVSKSMPSLTFMNPKYDRELGDVPSVYRG